ncbi:hypothetical protein [Vibrio sp. 624788]|uniref:hypothetical protein n=1 Tax=Vibrio sp. 624788 TaxID=1234362 RepID=UPI000307AF72|nr:hypothetical protein [Vibrio sp. 624788]
MNYKFNHSWKILIPLKPSSPNYLHEHKLFVRESGKSFLRKVGGGMEQFPIKPEVLLPTVVFHNSLAKIAKELGFEGKKFPYHYDKKSLNVKIHYYFEKYIVLTVTHSEDSVDFVNSLKERTDLDSYSHIEKLTLAIGGLVVSGDHKAFTPLSAIPTFSCTNIELKNEGTRSFGNKDLVEALTGHIDPIDSIVSDVLSRNTGHQTNSALTLIDKQGVIQQIPYNYIGRKEALKKYESCCNLFELFYVASQALKDDAMVRHNIFKQSLKNLVDTPENVVQSFTARRAIEQFVRDFHLSNALMIIEQQQSEVNNQPTTSRKSFREGWTQFYASKEFFAIIFGAIVTGVVAGAGLVWAYLKTL